MRIKDLTKQDVFEYCGKARCCLLCPMYLLPSRTCMYYTLWSVKYWPEANQTIEEREQACEKYEVFYIKKWFVKKYYLRIADKTVRISKEEYKQLLRRVEWSKETKEC